MSWNTGGATNHSLGFLIMIQDPSAGQIVLSCDGVRIDWPNAPTDEAYTDADAILAPAVEAIGGTYMKIPRWNHRLFGNHLITAHPLGDCTTADSIKSDVHRTIGRTALGRTRAAGL